MANEKLEKLLTQEKQLKARIQKTKAQIGSRERKERTGRLIAWGVVMEQMLLDPEESLTAERLALQCQRFLNGRTLERALTGPLEVFGKDSAPEQVEKEGQLVS